jgi:hypothetical protein
MSEKRKSDLIILLKYRGKKNVKIELFNATQWIHFPKWKNGEWAKVRYRLRANGRWFNGVDKWDKQLKYFTWYEVRDLLWRSFKGPGKTPFQTRGKHGQ